MKKLLASLILVGATSAFAQMTPEGLWRNIDDKSGEAKAEIRIKAGADGTLSGVIEKAIKPDPEANCGLCTDDRKDKPKLGMEIIRGAKKADGKDAWEGGKILDPTVGKIYTLSLVPLEGGKTLQVRGYIGPFYRTQLWQRIQ